MNLIYKRQTENILSKCMPAEAHHVVAIHFLMKQMK